MELPKNSAARQFLRQVRQLLPCSRKVKDAITAPLWKSVNAFLAEEPKADVKAIQTRFGTPESIAATCLENTDTGELLRKLHVKQRIVAVVIVAVFLALLSWVGLLAHEELVAVRGRDGYSITEIEIDSIAVDSISE